MNGNIAYGCLFCRVGSENTIARRINEQAEGISAAVPTKIRKKYHDGECKKEEVILLPGYVFIRCLDGTDTHPVEMVPNAHNLLKYDKDHAWQLRGFDKEFAEFFFEHGLIEYSKAEFIDGRIHFLDGFLKGHDDDVIRLNKRMKTAEVKLEINGTSIWCGYEDIGNHE